MRTEMTDEQIEEFDHLVTDVRWTTATLNSQRKALQDFIDGLTQPKETT